MAEKGSQSHRDWGADKTLASQIMLADRLSGLESASEEEQEGNNSSGSGNNSPTLATSFFGKPAELGKERKKKVRQV